MPDNTFRDGDPRHIDIESASERAYWCKALGISESQLREIVFSVGTSAEAVRRALTESTRYTGGSATRRF